MRFCWSRWLTLSLIHIYVYKRQSLTRSTSNSAEQNRSLYNSLAEYMEKNPEKVGPWYEKAMHVKRISDSLYVFVGDLKAKINESNQEDLEAASYVMFSPRTGKGKELALGISQYKNEILALIEDPVQKKIISDNLTLNIPRLFEGTPVAAAVTLLTKLQSDVRYAEGEVLHTLTKDIDVHDVRAVSYTHLDVYKRQRQHALFRLQT